MIDPSFLCLPGMVFVEEEQVGINFPKWKGVKAWKLLALEYYHITGIDMIIQ